jgi:hypothetical protein
MFQANNFGITDQLQTVIGGGVYPVGAILNHSCAPNCILTYSGSKQIIRTLRDIEAGEELTHSYVDLCLPTPERRQSLTQL